MNIIDRFKNQRVAQKITHSYDKKEGKKPSRIQNCFRLKTKISSSVNLTKKDSKSKASYNGLQHCGSVWSCPVCASYISENRKNLLQNGFDIWREKDPCNVAIMGTFTTPHNIFQPLEQVLSIQDKAIRIMKNQPQRGKYKVWRTIMEEMCSVGSYTGRESTFGKNGWHPHRHECYLAIMASIKQLRGWRSQLALAFYYAFIKAGGIVDDFESFFRRSVSLDQINDDNGFTRLSSYITKIEGGTWTLAAEATKGHTKTGKNGNVTPFGMLDAIRNQDPHSKLYSYKYYEFVSTMYGKKQFFPSPGLNHFLGLNWKSDKEIMQDQEAHKHYYQFTQDEWSQILNYDIRGEIIQLTEGKNEFEFMAEMDELFKNYQLEKVG